MAENIIFQVGNLTSPPKRRNTKNDTMATFSLGLNNDRRYDRKAGGYVDGPTAYLNVICFGQLAENVLAGNWETGLQIIVLGHLSNDDYNDPDTGKKIRAFQFKAIHAGPSSRFAVVTAVKPPKTMPTRRTADPTGTPVRAGDTFADITAVLKEAERRNEAPVAA